jgi:hypothetical protein
LPPALLRDFGIDRDKLSRTYVTLVEALNRHRGKGQAATELSFETAGRPSFWTVAQGAG